MPKSTVKSKSQKKNEIEDVLRKHAEMCFDKAGEILNKDLSPRERQTIKTDLQRKGWTDSPSFRHFLGERSDSYFQLTGHRPECDMLAIHFFCSDMYGDFIPQLDSNQVDELLGHVSQILGLNIKDLELDSRESVCDLFAKVFGTFNFIGHHVMQKIYESSTTLDQAWSRKSEFWRFCEPYELVDLIGSGTTAKVWSACKENCQPGETPRLAVKVQDLGEMPGNNRLQMFVEEVEFSKIADSTGFGPRVITAGICRTGKQVLGYIITDLWTGSLRDFTVGELCKRAPIIKEILGPKIEAMHKAGIVHNDMLPKNILYLEVDGQIVDVALTDFGLSFRKDEVDSLLNISELMDYHFDFGPTTLLGWLWNRRGEMPKEFQDRVIALNEVTLEGEDAIEANPFLLDSVFPLFLDWCSYSQQPPVWSKGTESISIDWD